MKIIINENQFKRLILKETHGVTDMQNKEMVGKLAKEKERIDAEAPPPIEWKNCSADVKNHNGPVLVFFSRDYCSPCKKLKRSMDEDEDFREIVHRKNIMVLYMHCETPYWVRDVDDDQKCRVKKCSDGKTFHEDVIDTTTKFGGDGTTSSGLHSPDKKDDGKWSGVPKLFLSDSSFNKQIKLSSNIEDLFWELSGI